MIENIKCHGVMSISVSAFLAVDFFLRKKKVAPSGRGTFFPKIRDFFLIKNNFKKSTSCGIRLCFESLLGPSSVLLRHFF